MRFRWASDVGFPKVKSKKRSDCSPPIIAVQRSDVWKTRSLIRLYDKRVFCVTRAGLPTLIVYLGPFNVPAPNGSDEHTGPGVPSLKITRLDAVSWIGMQLGTIGLWISDCNP